MEDLPAKMGGQRSLRLFLIADCSGSMDVDGKIQALNTAVREALPEVKSAARDQADAEIEVRLLTFSNGAQWKVANPVNVVDFEWEDLSAGGQTDMGEAFAKLTDQLAEDKMPRRGLRPVLVLISDGQPTDDDYEQRLTELLAQKWAKKAVRISIGIGEDADHEILKKFASPEIPVLQANNAPTLTKFIKWATTTAVQTQIKPQSETTGADPELPPLPEDAGQDPDTWVF